MTTIKAYTDLSQSKKLAEILPIESADMWWSRCTITDFGDSVLKVSYAVEPCNISQFRNTKEDIPCWSLAALLGVLPTLNNRSPVIPKTFDGKYRVLYHSTAYEKAIYTEDYDNPVDACVVMIEKLNKLKML